MPVAGHQVVVVVVAVVVVSREGDYYSVCMGGK